MLPFAARRIGEKDLPSVRRGLRQAHVAVGVYVALAAPVMFVVAPPLARHLSGSPVTLAYLVPALRVVPLGALLAAPFFLCRPVFEGMGRGRPGLTMSVLRYVVLAAPAAVFGLWLAPKLHVSQILGLVGGLMTAAAISSLVFLYWTRNALIAAAKPTQNPPAAA
jgi:Na+-driven multidrug efflux pump